LSESEQATAFQIGHGSINKDLIFQDADFDVAGIAKQAEKEASSHGNN
jgi:hypothetical protein